MFPILIKTKKLALDILFPPLCLNCQKYINRSENTNISESTNNNFLCAHCYSSINLNTSLFCPVCRLRLAENKRICHHSQKIQPYHYLLAAAGNYDDPVLQNLIHCFKYRKFDFLALLLGETIIKYLNSLLPKFSILNSIIVPIPLHFWRERERGFNQAKLLAKIIADRFNLPLIDGLKRIKNNLAQVKLKDFEKRTENVVGCFKIKNPELIKNKNVILIDDVFTSGATMNEAVKVLKQNGARRIIALVLAKA